MQTIAVLLPHFPTQPELSPEAIAVGAVGVQRGSLLEAAMTANALGAVFLEVVMDLPHLVTWTALLPGTGQNHLESRPWLISCPWWTLLTDFTFCRQTSCSSIAMAWMC